VEGAAVIRGLATSREKLGDRLKVLDRNEAPHLLKKSAWQSLPAEAFDVLVLDSLDASAEGVGERDSAKPSRAMARSWTWRAARRGRRYCCSTTW
jgi:hypothetical protein